MGPLKRFERGARQGLLWAASFFLASRRRVIELPAAPKILVVRLDERVGNLLLLTPLLATLRGRFPAGQIDVLGFAPVAPLLARHPGLSNFVPFNKRRWWAADGPVRLPWRLRQLRYDVAIDASNPTDPSTTQAFLVRLCGARHTVGVRRAGVSRLFSAPVVIDARAAAHEIDLRLQLLTPLPGGLVVRHTSFTPPALEGLAPGAPLRQLLAQLGGRRFAVINVGARLASKRLSASSYAQFAARVERCGCVPVITFGPSERALATETAAQCDAALLAPPTGLDELGALLARAALVVTCDTGPMHLAVAVGTPTLGVFVSTEPARYGYTEAPHGVVDARGRPAQIWKPHVQAWIEKTLQASAGSQ